MAKNIEFKAKGPSHELLRSRAREMGAVKQGLLRQHDTYFRVRKGRKKIRKISGSHSELITYFRSDKQQARESRYFVRRLLFPDITHFILKLRHGILAEVIKERELWLCKSVRIHLDDVQGLGQFMELEAVVSQAGSPQEAERQCHAVMDKLEITQDDMIASSYCDLLIYH